MKKIIGLLLIVCCLFSLVACGGEAYPPVESTEEEARTVIRLTVDNKTYEVRYELFRALFLAAQDEIDGGDRSVWTSPEKDEYIARARALVLDRACEIYSVLHLADRLGLNPYSSTVEKRIREYVALSVEGAYADNAVLINGFNSYEDYLAYLKENYLNYSVQALLFRYAIALDMISVYYKGEDENHIGALEYNNGDLRAFYESEECVRVLRAFLPKKYNTAEDAQTVRDSIAAAQDEEAAANIIIRNSVSADSEIRAGELIGRYSLDYLYYGKMTEAAFALGIGETSQIIRISSEAADGYFILYRCEKTEEHLQQNREAVADVYCENYIGALLHDIKIVLAKDASFDAYLDSLDYSAVSMD